MMPTLACDPTSPTVVLLHGAFADQSYWFDAARHLKAQGMQVVVRPNPLTGLAADAEYTARGLRRLRGPVVLVGHSYGGAVISVAAEAADNVVGLVYVAGYILERGEAFTGSAPGRRTDQADQVVGDIDGPARAALHLVPSAAPRLPADPTGQPGAGAVTQLHGASIFDERPQAAAWKRLPAWAVVATDDQAIDVGAQRRMASRAHAMTTEIDGGHAVALSHPEAVVDVICSAVSATSPARAAA